MHQHLNLNLGNPSTSSAGPSGLQTPPGTQQQQQQHQHQQQQQQQQQQHPNAAPPGSARVLPRAPTPPAGKLVIQQLANSAPAPLPRARHSHTAPSRGTSNRPLFALNYGAVHLTTATFVQWPNRPLKIFKY
jgi:hypothetical protein